MSFDFVKIFETIDLHKNDLDVDNFMTTVINHCHQIAPYRSLIMFSLLLSTQVRSNILFVNLGLGCACMNQPHLASRLRLAYRPH